MTDARDQLVRFVASLGRQDAYGEKIAPGYRSVRTRLSSLVIERHLSGRQPIGIYLGDGATTQFAVFDLDDHGGRGDWGAMAQAAARIATEAACYGLRGVAVRSGGGSGIHLFFHWAAAQLARDVRHLLSLILAGAGFQVGTTGVAAGTVEIFPKQDVVPSDGVGSLIALPGARSSVPLHPETYEPLGWDDINPYEMALNFSEPVPPSPEEDKAPGDRVVLPGDGVEAEAALKSIAADDFALWVKIGLALKHSFGDDGFQLFEQWSSKSAKFDAKACADRWRTLKPSGSVTLGTLFHEARAGGWNGPGNPIIREMNVTYGVFTHGRTTDIILKTHEGGLEHMFIGKAQLLDRMAGHTFEQAMADGSSKRIGKADFWLKHKLASHYSSVVFDPALPPGHNGEAWNIWRGFAVSPEAGDWSLLKDHILQNICQGDQQLYDWMLNWMALGVQQPALVIGTAPVLIGFPGTGKGVLAHAYARLWGEHAIAITHAEHVIGRFQGHLFGRRFVFIDEGTFGGNRKDAGTIKTRLTDPEIVLERKGVDAVRMQNKMITMIASNEASVVPADKGDRRWMVIEVGNGRREDHAYFGAISKQLDEGGYEAMLHELLGRDLSRDPDPRRTIKTEALFEQMLLAQPADVRYLHAVLDQGRLPQNVVAGPRTTTIRALVVELHRAYPDGRRIDETRLGRFLNKVIPAIRRLTAGGTFIAGSGEHGPIKERSTAYFFPQLDEARSAFARYVKMPVIWSDVSDWQSDPDSDDAGGIL